MASPLRVALAPSRPDYAIEAVVQGGGEVVGGDSEAADALVWDSFTMDGVLDVLGAHPGVRWVQLPMAGVERFFEAGIFASPQASGVTWTCAKGSYARPVAEHALLLALAGLRQLPERARARSWGQQAGISLFEAQVTILGGGGITQELLALLAPFGVHATVVRKSAEPLEGAERTVPSTELRSVLPSALVVFVALALTPETEHIISAPELAQMSGDAWLVNVARGRHVDTGALVTALQEGHIGGAALDVTDPEPLPDGHPLWALPKCLITPHTADTVEMIQPLYAKRIKENVQRFASGQPLIGLVDTTAGY
jgi:phosphoglycerate dehydrogenase-like enzyme